MLFVQRFPPLHDVMVLITLHDPYNSRLTIDTDTHTNNSTHIHNTDIPTHADIITYIRDTYIPTQLHAWTRVGTWDGTHTLTPYTEISSIIQDAEWYVYGTIHVHVRVEEGKEECEFEMQVRHTTTIVMLHDANHVMSCHVHVIIVVT